MVTASAFPHKYEDVWKWHEEPVGMKHLRFRNLIACVLLFLLLIAGLVVLPVVREWRQEAKKLALLMAVKHKEALTVTRLLDQGADVNSPR